MKAPAAGEGEEIVAIIMHVGITIIMIKKMQKRVVFKPMWPPLCNTCLIIGMDIVYIH